MKEDKVQISEREWSKQKREKRFEYRNRDKKRVWKKTDKILSDDDFEYEDDDADIESK